MNALKDLILRYLEIARDTIKLLLVFFSFWISSFFAARFGSVVRFLFLPFSQEQTKRVWKNGYSVRMLAA